MRAGLLRHQITIQTSTVSRDSSGSTIDTWATYAVVMAAYEPQSGSESFKEDQEQATQTVKYRIRFLAGITPKMRVLFDSRVFDILSVIDVGGRNKQLHLVCSEHV
jgi:SPP1 family predicted phage head-tail adaptor